MKNWAYPVIGGLVVLVVIAGIGGYMVGHRAGLQQANTARANFVAQRLGGQVPAGAQGLAGNGAGARQSGMGTNGTVKSVDGNSVVVTTRNGDVKVQLAQDTAVEKMDQGSAKDIQPGMRIVVNGETANGVVTARSVQLLPAGN